MINLEEVAVEANCREEITRQSHSLSSLFRSPSGYSAQVIPITTTPPNESTEIWVGGELIPQDAWLPITESRNGNELEFNRFYCLLHLPLLDGKFRHLPVVENGEVIALLDIAKCLYDAIARMERAAEKGKAIAADVEGVEKHWGTSGSGLSLAFAWQLYTSWLLVHLHESNSGIRYSRYLHLAITAFGPKLGKLLTIFPVMYLSGGTCAQLIIIGGGTMKLFLKNVWDVNSLTATECFFLFICMAIVVAQLPNLNSIAWVSLIGATTAIAYCTLIWGLSIGKGRPSGISYNPPEMDEKMDRFGMSLNALGIIVLAFRGHNVILEIQGTLPSSPKQTSQDQMWRGVTVSYAVTAMCFLSLAVAGFWAYGNNIPSSYGRILSSFSQFNGHKSTSKFVLGLICILVVINCLSTFQIYSMVVFDNLEFKYTSRKNKPCAKWLRIAFRILFGGLVFFIAVAFPFLPSLAPLIGGMTLPLAYAYPCFMWITMKKPEPKSAMWCVNIGLGFLGLSLSVVLVIVSVWNLADKGLRANFFRP
ncbi:hypothetical protein DVH24_010065 [Malus domestica]|uniref:Amino acid transporter transmembrane domain-containing protein n=1 Tax=Malus domestica TaxID=3750 RepID=A0A498JQM7_MALDO|nr:hypothetical protein DVH24_010065 [Malus domestica]